MAWLTTFLNSSIGKKFLMATTGLLLCVYLIIHLAGNLTLFGGPDFFNSYVKALSAFKPLVRTIEVILLFIFGGHIINGIRLSLENQKAKTVKYESNRAGNNSTVSSRTMAITGTVLLVFLITHLSTVWYNFQIEHESDRFFAIITGSRIGLENTLIAVLYGVAMIILGFHLRHGFQSAFQTFGLRYNRYGKLIEIISVLFWLIIPAGFLSIVIYFGFMEGVK
ncbi:MAG: succinate dehydrogenase cytochrome b subunit [Candidatus Marinimicrobia bacterium]|jgi:succinate dehydrogenase / fumarate reductase cytochrome b subunit|nr:succinate dehydrogenase cytochrome b subunit [Candidatus Neomarinimicrobiota bacterium]MBT5175895.1 succinate dehydrogenase cytochrome b subunit [Candidatus Neomarinimicrobiota bacterium]